MIVKLFLKENKLYFYQTYVFISLNLNDKNINQVTLYNIICKCQFFLSNNRLSVVINYFDIYVLVK